MTEDEAKTKLCCGSPVLALSTAAIAKLIEPGVNPEIIREMLCCRGATCMAWRWSEGKRTAAFLEAVQAHMQTQPKPNFNAAVQKVYAERGGQFERSEGFCGLAGAIQ